MKKILIANWKMQLDYRQSVLLAKNYQKKIKKSKNEIIIAPEFSAIEAVSQIIKKTTFKLGAQNTAGFSKGAYTGEVSPVSLKQLGVKYVLIGHSERRTILKEDSKVLKMKMMAALEAGLKPVLCIGENLASYKNKKTHTVLRHQLEEVLFGLNISNENDLLIAYEPIWAIGSGKAMTAIEAESNHVFIKGVLAGLIGQIPKVLYGGSVNSKNAADFLEWPNIDGLLVGGASLQVDEFSKIAKL
jgi:triosephosphate isomerase